MKYLALISFFAFPFKLSAQQCGNCKLTPTVAGYDVDVQVTKLPDTDKWKQLYWLGKHAIADLSKNNKNCVRFTQPSSYDDGKGTEILNVGETYTNIPAAKKDLSAYGNYLITGTVTQSGNGYVFNLEIQSSCSRKVVASSQVPFQLSSLPDETVSIAQQAAGKLSPLIDKIKKFELEERNQNPKFAIAGKDIELIKITPAKTKLTAGQQTEFTLELKDCDGVPLGGREIVFTGDVIGGNKMPGTTGGIVTPAKVATDAQGKAKATFKMTGKPAVINAHTLTQTPLNCQGVLFGDAQIDALNAYKVTVSYFKNAAADFNMSSDEDGVAFKGGDQKREDVAYSFSLLHYPATALKDGEQIMIMPQFEDTPEYQKSKLGKTVILYNEGYSEYNMIGKDLELVKSPFGAPPPKDAQKQRYFSDKPLPPSVSFIIENNQLVFFSGGVEFPEVEDGLSPVSSSFGIEKDNKKYFPLKPKKVTDPNSPYKWVYEFQYQNKDGYSQEGKVFTAGRKEVETATVEIWSSF